MRTVALESPKTISSAAVAVALYPSAVDLRPFASAPDPIAVAWLVVASAVHPKATER